MKRTLLSVIVALVVLAGAYGIAGAVNGPHIDYRTGYAGGCSNTASACHSITKGTFLPSTLDKTIAPNEKDYNDFCVTCHNVAGEAHNKSAGSPSTNVYSGQTTLVPGSYKGTSHSWNGANGNAGTRTPTLATLVGYMDNGKAGCQTCHDAMEKATSGDQNIDWVAGLDQGDHMNYRITGYTSTSQHLAQYVKVYKNTVSTTRPTNSRTKNTYLVSPSLYTYDYATAMVTFSASQGTSFIYIDILQPYMRAGNTANALCLDCHNNRNDSAVSHAPGDGSKDNHPAILAYGHTQGLNDTLKATPDANIYLEGGNILCTSCHDPHNAPSNTGSMLRNAGNGGSDICTDCHKVNGFDGYSTQALLGNHNGGKHTSPTVCNDCHTGHNTNNIMLIKEVINGKRVNFLNFTGSNSFGNDTGSSVCEACHAATNYHKADGTGTGHNAGANCTACHSHAAGFAAGGDCGSCHGFPPDSGKAGPTGWADTTGDAHHAHKIYLEGAPFNLSGAAVCDRCHGNGGGTRGDHNTNKNTAGIDTSTWGGGTFSDNGTIGKANTADDTCSNVSCHTPATGTRTWAGGGGCDSCHGYPPATNAHAVMFDGATTAHLKRAGNAIYAAYTTYGQAGWMCGKCHNNTLDKHKNGLKDCAPGDGLGACGGEFTLTVTTTGSDVTCSNVACHGSGGTTPNWY
ncbi:MAG: hypothetical protein HZA22_09480 [Nitrospirae bacterium]|nr:hypothetical protein [Nitrospirota bacterium]